MIFGGTWFCYTGVEFDPNAPISAVSVWMKTNVCEAAVGSGSGPVKITEAREYAYEWWTRGGSFLGLYRHNETTFVW